MMEIAKHHADQLLENTPKHTREYLYFENIRNGFGVVLNSVKKYQKIMEEK